MTCPHCNGDGCDPQDHGTAIVADCPVCEGLGMVPDHVHDTYCKGLKEGWEWEKFFQVVKR